MVLIHVIVSTCVAGELNLHQTIDVLRLCKLMIVSRLFGPLYFVQLIQTGYGTRGSAC
jgi:hypothetical protein